MGEYSRISRLESRMSSQVANRGDKDWQIGKSVVESNRYMWEKKIASDVEFEVGIKAGNRQKIKAHKFVLISRSPVFEAMFCGLVGKATDSMEVKDIEADVFEETLKYMYVEAAEVTPDNVLPILYASKKYFLPGLTDMCKSFLEKHFSLETVCSILEQSIFYDEFELTKKCLLFMAPRIQLVFETDAFLNMSQAGLQTLIRCDLLFTESEVVVYDACIKWAEVKCKAEKKEGTGKNIRAALGDVIYNIRFPVMHDVEFARVVGKSSILNDTEKSDIYYFLLTKSVNKGNNGDLKFDCHTRAGICGRYPTLGTAQQWWSCNGPTDAISFQADKDIDFIGVTVYGGKEQAHHNVQVELRDPEEKVLAKTNTIDMESDGSATPIPIYFPHQVRLKSSIMYTVTVTLRGPLTHYGCGGTDSISCNGVTLKLSTSHKSTNGTNAKSGQIPHLVFGAWTPVSSRSPVDMKNLSVNDREKKTPRSTKD